MADTKIEWADKTYNHWIGCTKVSPGCDHCYAESESKRRGWAVWGKGQPRQKTKYSDQPLKWNKEALAEGQRKLVFSASLADIFDQEVDPKWREEFWDVVWKTAALLWLVLTKRAHLIKKCLPSYWGDGPENVCLMTSVENQLWANIRVPQLIAVPAKYRGLSVESLLGPVKLKPEWFPHLSWVIVGGESGGRARPMHPDWARSLRDQCQAAGIPFFFKQWGCWTPDHAHFKNHRKSCMAFPNADGPAISLENMGKKERERFMREHSQMQLMFRTSKKRAGHLLDGREYQEHPFDLSINNAALARA